MNNIQCKGCSERCVGCHGSCEKYKAFREQVDRLNERKKEVNSIDRFRIESILKTKEMREKGRLREL